MSSHQQREPSHQAPKARTDVDTQHRPPSPRVQHKPNTHGEEELVYVLTLRLSDSISAPMNHLRNEHFPKRLNRVPAHITLFHALPHSQYDSIDADLTSVTSSVPGFRITTGSAFRMRKGIGVRMWAGNKDSKALHHDLQGRWQDWLSEQDNEAWRPHWTVMNKVDDQKKVAEAFEKVEKQLEDHPVRGSAEGLDLWEYRNGDWTWSKGYEFSG